MLLLIKSLQTLADHFVVDKFFDLELVECPHDEVLSLPVWYFFVEAKEFEADVGEGEELRECVLDHEGPPHHPIHCNLQKKEDDNSQCREEVSNEKWHRFFTSLFFLKVNPEEKEQLERQMDSSKRFCHGVGGQILSLVI